MDVIVDFADQAVCKLRGVVLPVLNRRCQLLLLLQLRVVRGIELYVLVLVQVRKVWVLELLAKDALALILVEGGAQV